MHPFSQILVVQPERAPDEAILPGRASRWRRNGRRCGLDCVSGTRKAAYDQQCGDSTDTDEATQAVITVPASFDEAARRATQQAAAQAGFAADTLFLEEPLAAVYAWIDNEASSWREQLAPGQLLFVCDIGGGTSDFSLIAVDERDGDLALERIAVGKHILLGGDNLDLALAYVLRSQIEAAGQTLDEWHSAHSFRQPVPRRKHSFRTMSWHRRRSRLLAGSSLFAGTVATELARETLHAVAVDGFFADVEASDLPEVAVGSALQELGLPYEADPVVTKHIAAFLTQARAALMANADLCARLDPNGDRFTAPFLSPDGVLFNGGVFHASVLRERVIAMLSRWAGRPVHALQGGHLDAAVARGAAVYGRMHVSGDGCASEPVPRTVCTLASHPASPPFPASSPRCKPFAWCLRAWRRAVRRCWKRNLVW